MRTALWTPAAEAPFVRALAGRLGSELMIVSDEPREPPSVEIDLYHVAGEPAHGFVYRALLRRPGIVLLADWDLHALVYAETAGRGDAPAYRREARHAHGDTGAFVARQVLAGLGGTLTRLLPMNQRVLEQSLALVAFSEDVRRRAARLLPGRTVVELGLDGRVGGGAGAPMDVDVERETAALDALVRELAPRAEAERQARAARGAQQASLPDAALEELRWCAREVGLAEPPADAQPLVASLFGSAR